MDHPNKLATKHLTRRTQVSEKIKNLLLDNSGDLEDRLPTVATLAKRFEVGVGTMHRALNDLEAEGFIAKKQGSGMFITSRRAPVTMSDTAAVCMESGTHLYGDLWSLLMQELLGRKLLPVGVDTSRGGTSDLIQRLSRADVRYFFVHPAGSFSWDVFQLPGLRDKPVFSFLDTSKSVDFPHLYRIETDLQALGQLATAHLWAKGCRRLLMVGTHTDEALLNQSALSNPKTVCFIASEWDKLGGKRTFLSSSDDAASTSTICFDEDRLVALFTGPDAPDAIMGTRDVEVWEAQQVLRRRLPDVLSRIKLCGVSDTPWSKAGSPPFTTVNLDLPSMVEASMKMLDALRAGKTLRRKKIIIEPKLIVREEDPVQKHG